MPADNIDIHRIMIDVRKAHRIMHEYVSVVRDGIKMLGNHGRIDFSQGFSLCGWSKYSSVVRDGKEVVGRWAWDWIPSMVYEFGWHAKNIKISVVVFSDTGYCDKYDNDGRNNESRRDISGSYVDPDSSRSLYLVFAIENETSEAGWRLDCLSGFNPEYLAMQRSLLDREKVGSAAWDLPALVNVQGSKGFGLTGDISDFLTTEGIDRVAERILSAAKAKDFKLLRKREAQKLQES